MTQYNEHWVEAAYRDHFRDIEPSARHGWSFMYVPSERLKTARVALVGLNPGGQQVTDEGRWDYRNGDNAYTDEPWGQDGRLNPLQREIKAMLEAIAIPPNQVFAAQLVPFRSRSWAKLVDREQAVATFRPLWRWVLAESPATLFLSLGKRAGEEIAEALDARSVVSHRCGWGNQTIDEYTNGAGQIVLAIPHLSRFRLFEHGRAEALSVLRSAAQTTRVL